MPVRKHLSSLTLGVALGLAAGAALPALAGYMDFRAWVGMSSIERVGYVAGVADTLEAVHQLILIAGPQGAAEAVRRADTCTDPLKLGQVVGIAEEAAAKHQDQTPAATLVLALADCGQSSPPTPRSTPSQ
jgi:hypothetical protein